MPEEQPRSRTRRITSHPLTHLFAALLVLGLTQAFIVKMFAVPSESMEHTLEIGDRLLVNRLAYAVPGSDGPQNGDVVVFKTREELGAGGNNPPPEGVLGWVKFGAKRVFGDLIGIGPTTNHFLVKRVIGVPGQTVECCSSEGRVLIDDGPIDEPYIFEDLPFDPGSLDCSTEPRSTRCFPEVTVPRGSLLVLGDHRSASGDGISACRGSALSSGDSCVRWVRADDVLGKAFLTIWPVNRWGGVS